MGPVKQNSAVSFAAIIGDKAAMHIEAYQTQLSPLSPIRTSICRVRVLRIFRTLPFNRDPLPLHTTYPLSIIMVFAEIDTISFHIFT